MRLWCVLALLACAPTYRGSPPALPTTASDSLLLEALNAADLVVLGTPDTMVAEQMLAPSVQMGSRDAWWNIRITVEQVAKGKLKAAKHMDYGSLPVWLTPPRPFKLRANQIMVQSSSRWQTAPVVVGERAIYFLKKHYNGVDMPNRTQYTVQASPWFALLAVSPDLWPEVTRLVEHGRR